MSASLLDSCADVFVALADPSRRLILERLAVDGPQSASTLATDMPITRQAVLKHLASLGDAELVQSQRSGREVLFIARPQRLQSTADALERIGQVWGSKLLGLKAAIEATND
jgi:predicted ArsR family transcriptional regulator